MTDKPKASRMERQVRNLGRGLFGLSGVLLIVCVAMTGMYGYSLGTDPVNGALLAFGFGAADIAGGLSASFCGACYALKTRKAGTLALVAAVACFAFSFYGVVGFQSTNRETLAQAREKATKISDDTMAWSRQTAITAASALAAKATGKSQAEILTSGIHAVGEQAEKQIKLIQSGALPTADATSATLSRVFRLDEQTARSYAISGGSALLLAIQYFCLWAYGFARHSLEPAVSAQSALSLSQFAGDKSANFPAKPRLPGFSDDEARDEFALLLRNGFRLDKYGAYSFLARRFGWTPHRTIRWLRQQPGITVAPPKRRKSPVERGESFAVALNGNGRAHVT